MKAERITGCPSWGDSRGQVMKTPDDVAQMLGLQACGWGLKRIARELGCSHHTVKAYVAAGGMKPFKVPKRAKKLDGHEDWLRAGHSFASWEAFEAHLAKWECDVANVRVHGTTGEAPLVRFERDEAHRPVSYTHLTLPTTPYV